MDVSHCVVMWVLGTELGSSGRAATVLHTKASLKPHAMNLNVNISCTRSLICDHQRGHNPWVALNKLFMCTIYMQYLQRPQEIIQFPGTGVISCGLAKVCSGNRSGVFCKNSKYFESLSQPFSPCIFYGVGVNTGDK